MAVTDSPPNGGSEEKNVGVPAYVSSAGGAPDFTDIEGPARDEDWATRNGLSLNSFKKRSYGHGIVELDRSMKPRHLHMIAIGGSIGAGFFVGSGSALRKGGPGFLLIDFMIMGIMIFNVAFALGELAVMYPVTGGFYTYSARFIDPSWGFAMGWNYVFQWLIVVPLELTVCAISIAYWDAETSPAVWITVFWVFLIIVNVFGTLGYAEEEFWASLLKLSAIVIFMIISFVLVLGGGPKDGRYGEYWGARYWYDPGAFANGFKGFCSVFVTAAFSFSGTELVGLAAAETPNPAKSLPSAIRQVFWRITLFYVLGLFFVGLLVPYNDDALLGSSSNDPAASPFVLIGKYAGLRGFDHFMNVIILVSVVSIGVSGVYGGSRTLTGLAQQGYAPKIFTYVDKSGRPLASVGVHLLFGALAYMTLSAGGVVVFNWFLSLSGLAALFTWGSICYAHIRFRQAWAYHGHTLDEIPFQAVGGVYGSWMGLFLVVLVLIFALYTAISPIGKDLNTAEGFFADYLAIFVVIVFWIIGYLWKRTGWLKLSQIDVDTGRRQLDVQLIADYRAHVAAMPTWRRIMHHLF
ncbi:amino acid permease/ SLC12A domain-containing protein [Microdochium trichocladiopsis]|uniref:Amino acid permease/ SLC12A domain-containing protein n=1 Tax=Microdochium trichocladiopsis TaxID=1682393 RepID=A0A9P9BL95_9PEZI|nr:amino acid permease/ SLC12A domain-containing protein [Microdochium trichocladiopsis]KAH7027847.1 amino acid permease/ SLC12A domain-containing protein [Microdochium trichocladiopsis]